MELLLFDFKLFLSALKFSSFFAHSFQMELMVNQDLLRIYKIIIIIITIAVEDVFCLVHKMDIAKKSFLIALLDVQQLLKSILHYRHCLLAWGNRLVFFLNYFFNAWFCFSFCDYDNLWFFIWAYSSDVFFTIK